MDWIECNNKKIVKPISTDENLIQSLLKTSEKKMESQELLPFNETTLASKISLAYNSIRELLEALSLKKGFKIYNHECYTAFLKEVLIESDLGDDFNEIRKLRNDINYYGQEISIEESKIAIEHMKNLKKAIESFI